MSSVTSTPMLCNICQKPTALRCSRCKAVYYCSKEHIREDWPSHKVLCQVSTSSASGSSEDTLKVTGILFPYNEDNPRLVEVDYKVTQDDDDPVSWDNLNLDPWLKGFRRCHEITHMEEDGPPLGRTLQMWYNDDFIRDSSPLNRCIARLVPDNGHPWGDNILVTRVKQPSMTYPEVRNATLDDIEPTLAHIRAYGQRVVRDQRRLFSPHH